MIKIWTCRKFALTLHRKTHGTMAEWLGIGLQNRAQQFDSAWYLTKPRRELHGEAFFVLMIINMLCVWWYELNCLPLPETGVVTPVDI